MTYPRNRKIIIGMDPGFTGAIGVIDLVDNECRYIEDMPTLIDRKGKKQIDVGTLSNIVLDLDSRFDIQFAAVEKVGSMPNQGLSSTFRFGYGAGTLEGVLRAHDVDCRFYLPQMWKACLGLSPSKKESLILARKLWPDASKYFKRAKDDGRAEACLIAHYARKLYNDLKRKP